MKRTASSKKALRKSLKQYEINHSIKRHVHETIKEVQALAKAGKKKEAQEKLIYAYKIIDKAAKRHIFHKNKASRKKSALAKLLK